MKENMEKVMDRFALIVEDLERLKQRDDETIQKAFRNIENLGIEPMELLKQLKHLQSYVNGLACIPS